MAKLFCNRVFGFHSSFFLSFFDTLREGDMRQRKIKGTERREKSYESGHCLENNRQNTNLS